MARLKPFLDDLPIPELVSPQTGSPDKKIAMAANSVKMKLHKDLPKTEVWSYRLDQGAVVRSGTGVTYLGPTIEIRRADKVRVAWKNKITAASANGGKLPYEVVKVPYTNGSLPVPQNEPGQIGALPDAGAPNTFDRMRAPLHDLQAALVTHLYGGRTQADSDGWPDNTAIPGQSAYFTYHNDQAATMLWYHDHANHITRLNVFAGLAGVWLIRDEEENSLGLPDCEFELPLVIQDRNLDLDASGNFTGALLHKTEVTDGPAEFFGPYTLVNGKIWPKAKVEPRLYRLRLLNGSNARTYRLMLLDALGNSQHTVIWQIGGDQGLAQNKIAFPADGLVLAPGERADLLMDLSGFASQKLYLWNSAEAPFSNTAPIAANRQLQHGVTSFACGSFCTHRH
jgi:spore coat protein A